MNAYLHTSRRRGLTLIELLVAVGLIMILVALAIPTLKFALDDRKTREASRILNAFAAGAKSRAAEKGRPVGIWFERHNKNPGAALRLFMAEVAPPYSGDVVGALARVSRIVGGGVAECELDALTAGSFQFLVQQGDIQVGDTIRFDYTNPDYEITSIDVTTNPSNPTIQFRNSSVPLPPTVAPGSQPPGVPFQITRRPVRSMVGSVELPESVAVDLTYSGFGVAGTELEPGSPAPGPQDTRPVVVMFDPGGGIDRVYFRGTVVRPSTSVHFLIGVLEQVGNRYLDPQNSSAGNPDLHIDNLEDPASLWVSLGQITGSVTSSENREVLRSWGLSRKVNEARLIARRSQAMGGR